MNKNEKEVESLIAPLKALGKKMGLSEAAAIERINTVRIDRRNKGHQHRVSSEATTG